MNALELANELDESEDVFIGNAGYTGAKYKKGETIEGQAATMLRKQHAEIENLRKIAEEAIKQGFYEDDFHKAQKEIERLQKARCVACGWNPSLIGGKK